jgi:hypothetical protein
VSPELSAILVGDGPDLGRLLRCLGGLPGRERIELVVVAPAAAHADVAAAAPDGIAGLRVVERPPSPTLSPGRAAGIRAATAPVVVFTETHCFPQPGWVDALLERHREGWAGVAPTFGNANPGTGLSWANLLIDYGPFLHGPGCNGTREVGVLPGQNSSYKRDVLLAYGDELEARLEFEWGMQLDLRRRGHRLALEPAARTHHVNITRLGSWLPERWRSGRTFGARRAQAWSRPRKLGFGLASPLIAPLRLGRALGHARRADIGRRIPRALPWLAAGLVVQSLGEGFGCLVGPGESGAVLVHSELYRFDHLGRRDDPA